MVNNLTGKWLIENDGWGYEEEHEWYIFRYIGEPKKQKVLKKEIISIIMIM